MNRSKRIRSSSPYFNNMSQYNTALAQEKKSNKVLMINQCLQEPSILQKIVNKIGFKVNHQSTGYICYFFNTLMRFMLYIYCAFFVVYVVRFLVSHVIDKLSVLMPHIIDELSILIPRLIIFCFSIIFILLFTLLFAIQVKDKYYK